MCRPGRRSVPSLSQHVKNLIYNISLHNRVTSFLTQWTVQISRPTNIPKGTFLHSTILQTQSDQSTNTTFYLSGQFYISTTQIYKLQSDQSTDLLFPQTKADIPTFLPSQPLQIYYPSKPKWRFQHSYHSNYRFQNNQQTNLPYQSEHSYIPTI